MVLVELETSEIRIIPTSLVTRNIELRGSTSASLDEYLWGLDLIAAGSLSPSVQKIPFEDVLK